MLSPKLLPALDAFLESAATARKWRIVGAQEKALKLAMRKAFVAQGKAFVKRFAKLQSHFAEAMVLELPPPVPEDEWGPLFSQSAAETLGDFVDPIQASAEIALEAGAAAVVDGMPAIDYAFNLKNPRAVRYIKAHGADLVTGINDTTRSSLRTLLQNAADEGWSYSKTARQIRTQFDGFAGKLPQAHIADRATLIAVSETGNAFEAGGAIVVSDLQDAGLTMQKRWLTVGDARTSEGCQANQDEGWIPFDDPFPSGDMQPLRHPACRCTTQYRREPD